MSFTFELFQPGFPSKVELHLPFTKPYTTHGTFFLGSTLAAEVARKLGMMSKPKRVHLMDERASAILPRDKIFNSGQRLCVYIAPDETMVIDNQALTKISLEGARHLITPGEQPPRLARVLIENTMYHNRGNTDLVYSLHRYISSVSPMHWRDNKLLVTLACLAYDDLLATLHRRSQRHVTSALRKSVGTIEEEAETTADASVVPSLLEVMRMLPPSASIRSWLQVRDLLRLGLTSRSWWRWVTTNELPELLRRTMSHLTLPFQYDWQRREEEADGYSQRQTGTIKISCTPNEDQLAARRSSSWPSSADFITRRACPPTLEWMLSEGRDSRMVVATASAVVPFIDKWYHAFLADPNTNTEQGTPHSAIREFLLAALPLATAIGLFTSSTDSVTPEHAAYSHYPHDQKADGTVAVCLLIPTSPQDQVSEKNEVEILWCAKWSSKTHYPF